MVQVNPKYKLRLSLAAVAIVLSMVAVAMAPATASVRNEKAETTPVTEPSPIVSPLEKEPGNDFLGLQTGNQGADYVPGEVIVKFKQDVVAGQKDGVATTGISSIDELNKQFEVKGAEKLLSGSHKLKIREDADVQYVASQYERNPNCRVRRTQLPLPYSRNAK